MDQLLNTNSGHWLLEHSKGVAVPPFCVEICMKDGRSYYFQTTLIWDNGDYAMLRIWDLRLMTKKDIAKLHQKMNDTHDRKAYEKPQDIHENLDVANLHIPKNEIAYVVEWHDRWMPDEYVENRKKFFGFQAETGDI